jgi:flagellar FliL protein
MATEDELELDTTRKKSGGKGKIIMIIALVVLLTTGSTITALYFTGALGGSDSQSASTDNSDANPDEQDAKELVVKPAFYFDLQPAFVVNFEDQSKAAYLQVEMQLMAHDQLVSDQVTKHMPVIRNNILLTLSAQKYEVVKTRQGKEALQAELLQAVRDIIGPEMKKKLQQESETEIKEKDVPNVEQVYFTSFIMQ